jgi:hypothetical protein
MPLISLQQLKSFIHMGESYSDTLLQDIIDGELAAVEQMINQTLEEAQETEYHDGEDDNTLLLKYGLVTAITSVKIDWDGDGVFEDELIEHEDYEWYPNGKIALKSSYFPEGLKNVEVVYTHGFSFSSVSATNLPTDQGFQVFKDRPSFVAGGDYSGLDSVVLNTGPNGTGDTLTEGTDYAIMEHTGQAVALENGSITSGDTLYVKSGTYTQYSNVPKDLKIALLKQMANTFHASRAVTEKEGEKKIFSQKSIDAIFNKYTKVTIG